MHGQYIYIYMPYSYTFMSEKRKNSHFYCNIAVFFFFSLADCLWFYWVPLSSCLQSNYIAGHAAHSFHMYLYIFCLFPFRWLNGNNFYIQQNCRTHEGAAEKKRAKNHSVCSSLSLSICLCIGKAWCRPGYHTTTYCNAQPFIIFESSKARFFFFALFTCTFCHFYVRGAQHLMFSFLQSLLDLLSSMLYVVVCVCGTNPSGAQSSRWTVISPCCSPFVWFLYIIWVIFRVSPSDWAMSTKCTMGH